MSMYVIDDMQRDLEDLQDLNAELLEALKLAREYIKDDCGCSVELPEVEAAIAKAEGK